MAYFVGALMLLIVISALLRLVTDEWREFLAGMAIFGALLVGIAMTIFGIGMVVTGQWPWELFA